MDTSVLNLLSTVLEKTGENTDAGTATTTGDGVSNLVSMSSEGGTLFEIFHFLAPVGEIIKALLNIVSAAQNVSI